MKHLPIILIVSLITSCSIFKHKTENRSSQTDLTVHREQHRDSLQLSAQVQRLRFLSNDQLEITEIIPTGKFVYLPDSGFVGEATQLRVYRQARQQLLEKDTSTLSLGGSRERVETDSVRHEQARQQLEEIKKSKPVSFWIYVMLAGILLFLTKTALYLHKK